MTRKWGKAVPSAALCVVVACSVTACGDSGDDSDGGSGAESGTSHLTVAALPLVDDVALYIARDRGLFEKEGLDVRIQPVQQSIQALPALSKGQVDVIGAANYVTFLQAYEKGTLDLRILAEGARLAPQMLQVLVAKDSPLKTAADLKGKKVAVNILNNIQTLTMNQILDAKGAARPEYRQIAFPQMGPALQRHQVDAVNTVDPFSTAVKKELHARELMDGGAAPASGMPVSGYVTTRKVASGKARAVAAFQRAITAAQRIAGSDAGAVKAEVPKYTKVKPAQAASLNLPAYPTAADPEQLTRLIDLMVKEKLLEKSIDPADLLVSARGG